MIRYLACSLVAVLLPFQVSSSAAPLVMLTDPTAKCLDGTQAGYYVQQAKNLSNVNQWVLYLEGGGECDTESACQAQTYSSLGSSKYFAPTSDSSSWYLASDYCPYNPDLCGWNHARDPYCTQDLHAGQIENPDDSTWGLYFSGHLVFKAMLDALDQPPYNLADATDIILSGTSAGGIGVWMNLDYLAERYPQARVTGATIAGHYFYATYYDGVNHTQPGTMGDFREPAMSSTYTLYNAFVDETCKEAYESRGLSAGACLLSNNSLPYIKSDAYVVQSQTDSVVLTGHDTWPEAYMDMEPEREFMEQWHQNMTTALRPMMEAQLEGRPRYGVFAAACYIHGGFTHSAPLINGLSYNQAFSRFYFDKNTENDNPELYKLMDDCGLMCNPTCPQ